MSRRIPPNHPVRRRLFESTVEDEARNDNFSNKLAEEHNREYEEQSRKYHYDFRNDRPLPGEGNYQWFNENGKLTGVRQGEATGFEEGAEYTINNKDDSQRSIENDRDRNDNVLNGDANELTANVSNNSGVETNESDTNEENDVSVQMNKESTPIKVKPSINNAQ